MLYRNRYRIARGALWALLLLAALVLQGTVCNRLPLLGVSPLLLPVAAVCVAMMGSAEFGAAIGLAGGLLGYLGGGALHPPAVSGRGAGRRALLAVFHPVAAAGATAVADGAAAV